MTARTVGPGRPPLTSFLREERRSDRRALVLALGTAIVLHLVALLLPLPPAPRVQPPDAPPPHVIALNPWTLRPPDLPAQPGHLPSRTGRRIPVPAPDAGDPDPVVEPAPAPVESLSIDIARDAVPLVEPPPPRLDEEPMHEGAPGLVPPSPLGDREAPEYPELARRARAEGLVVLRAVISERGDVTSIEVLRAPEPDLGFRAAAIDAVSRWRYLPGSYRGRPVSVAMTVYVEFDLQ